MRSSYMKFLLRMTNNYLALLNRNIIDTLGTHSSFGFSDEPPVLQFEHTSRKFRETVLIWFIQ
ncbi:hypothetical protein B4U79_02618 [Dinothrombium tinctorium]|uniref:Uncharacterized protein n=1 Tax=Dinothrombium tinctorium TaxID=1965070 RepID=A0A3S3P2U2_9ACAR|nr:hypothetical protein B4U79_02618 [Dinothrombium tinctorium]